MEPKTIKLTKNQESLVDPDDWELYAHLSWQSYKLGCDGNFYAARTVRYGPRSENKKKMVYLHRLIAKANEDQIVDHINGNTLDNRKENLRIASKQNNIRNQRPKKNKFKGVFKHKGSSKFHAAIVVNYKIIRSGSYNTAEEAANEYNRLALLYFGEFARLNQFD